MGQYYPITGPSPGLTRPCIKTNMFFITTQKTLGFYISVVNSSSRTILPSTGVRKNDRKHLPKEAWIFFFLIFRLFPVVFTLSVIINTQIFLRYYLRPRFFSFNKNKNMFSEQ
jgi:hypothetical protein